MGFHGTSKGANIHVIHRWDVENAEERLAIEYNPDRSDITETNGLNCLCLQEDTGEYYRLSSIDPIEWIGVGGGTSFSGKLADSTEKEVLFNVHVPFNIESPFRITSGDFTNIYIRRVAPNIGNGSFDEYSDCLWDISEADNSGGTINSWVGQQFGSYTEMINFLNDNVTINDARTTFHITITCYLIPVKNIDPFVKIRGVNKFYGMLRGRDNYTSTSVKTMTNSNQWSYLPSFITDVYNRALRVAAPSFAEAVKTFWFPQTPKRMYDHHQNPIEFPSGNTGQRSYFSSNDGKTYQDVTRGKWIHSQDMYYTIDNDGISYTYRDNQSKDDVNLGSFSVIRISVYKNSLDNTNVAFFVKPVGMDHFYLGFHPSLKTKAYKLYAEYGNSDSYPRLAYIKDIPSHGSGVNYGMSTSLEVKKYEITPMLIKYNKSYHARTKNVIKNVRFRLISDDGTALPPSSPIHINLNQTKVKSYVLLK